MARKINNCLNRVILERLLLHKYATGSLLESYALKELSEHCDKPKINTCSRILKNLYKWENGSLRLTGDEKLVARYVERELYEPYLRDFFSPVLAAPESVSELSRFFHRAFPLFLKICGTPIAESSGNSERITDSRAFDTEQAPRYSDEEQAAFDAHIETFDENVNLLLAAIAYGALSEGDKVTSILYRGVPRRVPLCVTPARLVITDGIEYYLNPDRQELNDSFFRLLFEPLEFTDGADTLLFRKKLCARLSSAL